MLRSGGVGEIRQYDDVGLDLVAELRAAVLERYLGGEASYRSMNVGGWRSDESLFAWPEPAVRALRAHIASVVPNTVGLVGWAIVNRNGSYHRRHDHRGQTSGVYYLTGASIGDGVPPTIFELAGRDANQPPDVLEWFAFPRVGRLVVFPSDTYHRVEPYAGADPRITISFDTRP